MNGKGEIEVRKMNRILLLIWVSILIPNVTIADDIIKRSEDNCYKITLSISSQGKTYDPMPGDEERCELINKKYSQAIKYVEEGEKSHKQGDFQKVLDLYGKATELGDEFAPYIVARMYYKGNGLNQDYTKAAEWYLKAARNGNRIAIIILE